MPWLSGRGTWPRPQGVVEEQVDMVRTLLCVCACVIIFFLCSGLMRCRVCEVRVAGSLSSK